ncbi:MAG: chemotaxis protein CheW [Nitrospiraceae bacterium]
MGLRGQSNGPTSVVPTLRLLVATLGSRTLAFEADSVDGLLTVEVGGRAGVVIVQGVAYRPVDLARRLSLQAEENGPDRRVLLLSHGGLHGSVRVAQVQGLREVGLSQLVPIPRQFHGEEQHWYRGLIALDGDLALVLDMAWVLHEIGERRGENPLAWYERGPRVINDDSDQAAGSARKC